MEYNTDNAVLLSNEEVENGVDEIGRDENNNMCYSESNMNSYKWKVLSASVDYLVLILMGGIVCITVWFAFKQTPIGVFELHIGLNVIGYQLLIAHGLLSLRGSGWSFLPFNYRRRLHWILQLIGSITAIAGSAIMINEKSSHFTSMHGKFALAALIFTCTSLINGLSSLYSVELRRYVSPKLSKSSHSILGIAAFVLSSACLAFGYNKQSFKKWATDEFAYVMIGAVILNSFILAAKPLWAVMKKLFDYVRDKIC